LSSPLGPEAVLCLALSLFQTSLHFPALFLSYGHARWRADDCPLPSGPQAYLVLPFPFLTFFWPNLSIFFELLSFMSRLCSIFYPAIVRGLHVPLRRLFLTLPPSPLPCPARLPSAVVPSLFPFSWPLLSVRATFLSLHRDFSPIPVSIPFFSPDPPIELRRQSPFPPGPLLLSFGAILFSPD